MLSSQLFWRVFGVYAALTVGTALAFVGILSSRHRTAVHEQALQSLREQAAVVKALIGEAAPVRSDAELPDALRGLLDRVARGGSMHRMLLAPDGRVLWDSQPQDALRANIGETQEIVAAQNDGSGFAIRRLANSAEQELCYATRLVPDDAAGGFIRVSQPLGQLSRQLAVLDYRLWAAAAAIGVLSLATTYFVVGRIIGPLETLTHAAQQIADGDLPSEVYVRSRNEIGTLAAAFNSMSRQLSARIHDLQDQRRHVEQSHARLETVLGAMQEGVIAVDAEERILFANNAAIRQLDLKPTAMVGRPIWEAVRLPQLQDLVREALSGEQPPRLEFDVARTQSTVALTISPLPGQPVPGAVIVLHDVTELRRLESLRREFVQNVSHELKTPLSSIAAYADTLLEGGLDDPECNRHFVQQIAEQSDRLHGLILDLLALARMEAEEEVFDVSPTDVTQIVTASIDAHQGVAAAKRLILVALGPSESLFGLADDDGLRTILDNLLDNAINYTPAGGQVTVRWRQHGGEVVIDVEDTGMGIAKEHQARIFERFYRIDKARSRELGGTGLGLAIVKHLCQVFGGSVKVTSQLGQGSTFTVRLKTAGQLIAA